MTNKKLPTIKAEYLPGGAKRQELLDQVPEYLLKPGADQGTKHMFCIEMLSLPRLNISKHLTKLPTVELWSQHGTKHNCTRV